MLPLLVAVARLELQLGLAAVGGGAHRVEDSVLGGDERRQFREDHARHVAEVVLALEHAGEELAVRLQPVLLDVLPRRLPEVADHLVERVLQDGDLAARLHGDLPRQVALGDRGGHFRDRTHLVGEVGGELVDVVGQVLPDPADLLRLRLAAQLSLDADLAGDPRHLAGEGLELVDHRVDGVLQLQELALDVDRDLLAQVAVGHRGGHLGDVPNLPGQVAGHQVDVVGQVLPDAADLDRDRRGLTELAFGPDLAGHTRHFRDEAVELVDHRVDRVLELQHLAADVGGDLLAQVAVGDGTDHALHLDGRTHQVVDQAVDGLDAAGPALGRASEHDPLRQPALLADDLADPRELGAERLVRDDDVVEAVGDLPGHTGPFERHPGREIAFPDLGQDAQQDCGIDAVFGGRRRA